MRALGESFQSVLWVNKAGTIYFYFEVSFDQPKIGIYQRKCAPADDLRCNPQTQLAHLAIRA